MRILVLIAIGLLLYVIIGNLLRKNRQAVPKAITEKMVQCNHCDLHILEKEAVNSGDHHYCSQEHLEADS